MKNTKFFEVKCSINQEKQLSIRIPYSCHEDFSPTVSGRKEADMARLVEIFGEFAKFDLPKRQTFQALIEERADSISTLDDILALLKVVRLLDVFEKK